MLTLYDAARCPYCARARIVLAGADTVLIANQATRKRAQLEQPLPIGIVAGQPRDLQSQQYPGMIQSDFTHELLKPIAVLSPCAGAPLIAIDRMDTLDRPAERHGSIAQCVLPLRALGVLQYLPRGRLPDIKKSIAAQMFRAHLSMELSKHASPVIETATPCWR